MLAITITFKSPMLFFFFVAVLLSSPVVVAQRPPPYEEPLWYSRLQTDNDLPLGRCKKRTRMNVPPKTGDRCSRKPKACYFGTQDCDGVGAHPEIMCTCDGASRKWNCEEDIGCPAFRDPIDTGCPPVGEQEGGEMDMGNSALCPVAKPTGGSTCPQALDEECQYGIIDCCGVCLVDTSCDCTADGTWQCLSSSDDLDGACFGFDSCVFEAQFNTLFGATCLEARTAIFALYPFMRVVCQSESTPRPTTDDSSRYVVVLDDTTGLVKRVHWNYYAPTVTYLPNNRLRRWLQSWF